MRQIALLLMLASLSALAQMRMIPHVTPIGGDFDTSFQLINPTDAALDYELHPFAQDGNSLTMATGRLEAGETQLLTTEALFGQTVSHVAIPEGSALQVLVGYRDAEASVSSAHIPTSSESAYRWLLLPGEGEDVIDGFAIVNLDDVTQSIHVRQLDADQVELQRETIFDLAPNAKGLNIFQDFQRTPGAHYEIFADGPTALTALRFATGGTRYFWQSAAAPLPQLVETANQAPVITGQQTLSVESGMSITLSTDQLTITDADGDMNFSLSLSAGDNYTLDGLTVTPANGFSGNLMVPATVSDGMDSSASFDILIEVTAAQDPRIGQAVTFPPNSIYDVSGRAVISGERSITIEGFNYDGSAPDVRLYLAKNGDFANGIDLTGVLPRLTNATQTYDLPDGVTLDDFDSISVWCTIFLIDFSSGTFN